MKLVLRERNLKLIESHSLESLPNESCGLLLGKAKGNTLVVEEVTAANNVLSSPTLFEINPEFVCRALDKAEAKDLKLVGFYHSHPNIGAYVSARDAEFMRLWPGVAWVIVSVDKSGARGMRAFLFEKGAPKEIEIVRS